MVSDIDNGLLILGCRLVHAPAECGQPDGQPEENICGRKINSRVNQRYEKNHVCGNYGTKRGPYAFPQAYFFSYLSYGFLFFVRIYFTKFKMKSEDHDGIFVS